MSRGFFAADLGNPPKLRVSDRPKLDLKTNCSQTTRTTDEEFRCHPTRPIHRDHGLLPHQPQTPADRWHKVLGGGGRVLLDDGRYRQSPK